MPTLLHLDSAIADPASRSRILTAECARGWQSRGADFDVVTRDLHLDPPPHLRERSQHWPERLREGEPLDEATDALQRELIAELLAADAVVLGAPMYNYAVPSTLKAWIDLVHVPGITAAFDTPTQPLAGRSALIVTTQGGGPDPVIDAFVSAPLRQLFGGGFGMEVTVVAARRTLVDRIPSLGVAEAEGEFEAALSGAFEWGATVPVGGV